MGKDGIFAQPGSEGEPVTRRRCRLAQGHGECACAQQALLLLRTVTRQ